jgi:hypothetical protein
MWLWGAALGGGRAVDQHRWRSWVGGGVDVRGALAGWRSSPAATPSHRWWRRFSVRCVCRRRRPPPEFLGSLRLCGLTISDGGGAPAAPQHAPLPTVLPNRPFAPSAPCAGLAATVG